MIKGDEESLKVAEHIFEGMGACVKVKEEQIVPATALCAWYLSPLSFFFFLHSNNYSPIFLP